MNCELKIDSRCKSKKYHGQVCGRLRPMICGERKRLQLAIKLQRAMIESGAAAERELGIGA